MKAQRLLMGHALAREFAETEISPTFRVNGTSTPDSDAYAQLKQDNFVSWRLKIDGLVNRPQELSLADLKKLPARTQITRHDCVEGWSAIGKWTGVPLGLVLQMAGLQPNARYAVFYCADELEKTFDGSGRYYQSIDLVDAFHPQTILAYSMNGADRVGRAWRSASAAGRAAAWVQARKIRHAHLAGRQLWRAVGRQRAGSGKTAAIQWYAGI